MTEEEIDALQGIADPYDQYNLPGPIDWHNASHWIEYDHDNFTVELWCSMGPNFAFRLRQRIRPMCEEEIIYSKLRNHSREKILACFGINESQPSPSIPKRRWWSKWF